LVSAAIDKTRLTARVGDILNHWPVAGLAVAVVRGGSLEWFHGHYGSGTSAVVFSREPGGQVAALHLGFFPLSLRKRR
jgi:hypothetical protein